MYEPIYEIWGYWTEIHEDVRWDRLDDRLKSLNLSDQELRSLERREDEDFWLNTYIKEFYPWRWQWLKEKVKPNSFQHFKYGFQHFQGFCDWRREAIYIIGKGLFIIKVPHQYRYLVHARYRVVPVYGTEEYTIYKNTRYEILDYALDNWPTLQAKVTLRGLNGFQGEVRLSVEADELLGASLADENLWVGSSASTTLTIAPAYELLGSSHRLTIRATDGRLTRTAEYELDLASSPSPPSRTGS